MRNYLVVLVNRRTEEAAWEALKAAIAEHAFMTNASDILVTQYQPRAMPGNMRYMAVARITVKDGTLPVILPEMHLIAVD